MKLTEDDMDTMAQQFALDYMSTDSAVMDIAEVRAAVPGISVAEAADIVHFRAEWEFGDMFEILVLKRQPEFVMEWTF